jgi:nucleoside-diphosphate-sugar epimerase
VNRRRDLCYVDDTVDALMRAARRRVSSGPINVGTDREVTVLELARRR